MPKLKWRWLLALSSLPSFALLIFFSVVSKSPKYLCTQDRLADAQLILQKIALLNRAKLPSGRLISNRILDFNSIDTSLLISSTQQLLGLILLSILVDRIGKKLSMIVTFILACLFLLPLAFQQPATLTIGLLFGARLCTIGAFTVACIYAPELYPTSMRTTSAGVTNTMGRISGMVCPMVAIGLIRGCHQTAAVLFQLVMLFTALSILFLVD